jgi:hypothetical protein
MLEKPNEQSLFDMASDRIIQSHVGQTRQTGLSNIASDNCVQCHVGQAHQIDFFSSVCIGSFEWLGTAFCRRFRQRASLGIAAKFYNAEGFKLASFNR